MLKRGDLVVNPSAESVYGQKMGSVLVLSRTRLPSRGDVVEIITLFDAARMVIDTYYTDDFINPDDVIIKGSNDEHGKSS